MVKTCECCKGKGSIPVESFKTKIFDPSGKLIFNYSVERDLEATLLLVRELLVGAEQTNIGSIDITPYVR